MYNDDLVNKFQILKEAIEIFAMIFEISLRILHIQIN